MSNEARHPRLYKLWNSALRSEWQ